jgi:uncharacterized protein (DUF433 family)
VAILTDVIAAFSIKQVQNLTGLSEGQLVDWDASDFFVPAFAYENRRSPYSRIYSFEDVVGLRTLAILRNRVSMQHLREVAVRLKAHSGKPWSQLALYTLNGEVHFRRPTSGKIEGVVSGQYGATIPLESVAEEIREKAEALKKRRPDSIGKIAQRRFVMGGVSVVAGTRIPISSIRALADAGYSVGEIIAEYPGLTKKDIKTVIQQGRLTLAA